MMQVNHVIGAAKKSFIGWSKLSVSERAQFVLKVKDVIYEQRERVAEVICKDTGKPQFEALTAEVIPSMEFISYFCKRAKKILKEKALFLSLFMHKKSILRYEPYGVVLIISPWNFPFAIPMGDVVLALLAGNSVILKTSDVVPSVAKMIQELFTLAGFPSGVVQVLSGDAKEGAELVASPKINKIAFTGSTGVGKKILAAAAQNITPALMELGGKDAAIVCRDANIKKAAKGIVWGAFCNAGQVCASIQRVYVDRGVVQDFVEEAVLQTESLRLERDIGAITLPSQIERYQKQIEDALQKGAKILVGGMPEKRHGRQYFQPTLLINVTEDMLVMREETFGPLLPIMMVDSDDEAINHVNDSLYGLCASVWSKNQKRAVLMARKIEAGTVTINDAVFTHALCETPWGGYKQSGIGRTHGVEGLKEFSQVKHISTERLSLRPFWWFPYTPKSYQAALEFSDFVGAKKFLNKTKALFRFLVVYFLDK